jgi:hypothetical protein
LERSFCLYPLLRNKLLPVFQKFLISGERGPREGQNSVGTKFLSLSVAEKQTTSGFSKIFDFRWKGTSRGSKQRWNEVSISIRCWETNYFRFFKNFRFRLKRGPRMTKRVLESSCYVDYKNKFAVRLISRFADH